FVLLIECYMTSIRDSRIVIFSGLTCIFFFSSRRRHTRFSRDWSSDVCSSDLRKSVTADIDKQTANVATRTQMLYLVTPRLRGERSEERRVGKECRSRWQPDVCRQINECENSCSDSYSI